MERYIIAQDRTRADRLRIEGASWCKIIDDSTARLRDIGAIDTTTDSVINAILLSDETDILTECKERIKQDCLKLKNRATATTVYNSTVATIEGEVRREFDRTRKEVSRQRVNLQEPAHTFLQYIHAVNGRAVCDNSAILEDCTSYASDAQLEYIKQAEELAAAMVEFDRRTRIMTNNTVHFFDDGEMYAPSICVISDGKLYFDRTAIAHIDPTTEEQAAASWASNGRVIDNFKDCNNPQKQC